jgi:putative oxidoreductase
MHPPIASLGGAAGVIEIVAGALIVLGFYSRPAAFIASGTMAFAYFLAHFPRNFFPVANGGDASILFCFLFLYLAAAGPGAFSLNKK